MSATQDHMVSFRTAFLPIAFFFLLLLYGLFVHPVFFGGDRLPVEVLVLLALFSNCLYLLYLKFDWKVIEQSIVQKIGESIPVVLILFAVGVLIGSWIVSGIIPMLIYFGIGIIDGDWIYIFSFLICIIFSLLTGTSWGSAGTIGVVMIGIAQIYGADLSITAAAIVGGSFFGDKMSPLSDTTNIAALATDVPVMDHIKSMMYTTGPAAIIASLLYILLSPAMQGAALDTSVTLAGVEETMTDLKSIFNFNILLLLPLVVVIWGSITRKSIFLTLLAASWLAMILAFVIQDFTVNQIFESFNKGFSIEMVNPDIDIQSDVVTILNRGGLYNLIEGIVISILIFAFIGTLGVMNAIEISIAKLMSILRTKSQTVLASLVAVLFTNLTTSNQYATSFIVGEAFKKKYDQMGVARRVLSRSIEDAGTMMENLAPWTPSGIFMAGALGVTSLEYAPWQFMSLANIVIAFFFAATGIAVFTNSENSNNEEETS
ncbi:MAG: NhaC family Na+:H+ antiporter [Saprospiraceae bacterium]|jgi:NhaC family Na+:H+ antiporter